MRITLTCAHGNVRTYTLASTQKRIENTLPNRPAPPTATTTMQEENNIIFDPHLPPEPTNDPGWYVLRYHVLSSWLKEQLALAPLDIFHPYKTSRNKAIQSCQLQERPVLSGFIFVHDGLKNVKEYAQQLNLPIMLDPFHEDRRYVHISDREMKPFMKAAEMKAFDLQYFDPNIIDVEKDDLVEFIEGEHEGTRGYLKPGKGKNGGLVIVPLTFGNAQHTEQDKRQDPRVAPLAYPLEAHQNEIAIVEFAKGNRHAKDCIFNIKPVVSEAFQQFIDNGEIDKTKEEKLIAFVRRYGHAQLNTKIQEAQHYTLLYRINTILRNFTVCNELRKKIAWEIRPEIYNRKKAALSRQNKKAANAHQLLLDELDATDSVYLEMVKTGQ